MSVTQKIIESIEGIKEDYIIGECSLCGGNSSYREWHSFKDVISSNYTDYNVLMDKSCKHICYFCKQCINNRYLDSPKGKKCGIRLYSFLVENETFRILNKEEYQYYIFEYEYSVPFILGISFSGKKHISFKSIESYSATNFNICTEIGNICFDREKWKSYFDIIKYYYEHNITKKELRTCLIKPWKLNKYDLSFFKIQKLRKIKNTIQYSFMINIL